jgi:hypothetical protein
MHRFVILGVLIFLVTATTVVAQDPTPLPPEDTAEEIEDFLERLTTAPRSDVATVLLILGGLTLLVAGWRIYDFIIIVAGALIGAIAAASLLTTSSELILIGALLLGGLLGAALAIFLYYIAVFLVGAYVGIVLTAAGASTLGLTPVSALALLIGAIIGGIVLLALSFEFLILASSLVGAQMLALGLDLGAAWVAVFAIIGVIVQLALVRTFNYDFRRRRRKIRLLRRRS